MTSVSVSPSQIHFSYEMGQEENSEVRIYKSPAVHQEQHTSHQIDPETGEAESTSSFTLPKMQVFQKNGCFFALDNNCLKLYRQLQNSRCCDIVDVEVVPKERIPNFVFAQTTCHADYATSGQSSGSSASNSIEDVDEYPLEEDEDLICRVCHKLFSGVNELTKHKNSKKHFACARCGQTFTSSKALRDHETLTGHNSDDDG